MLPTKLLYMTEPEVLEFQAAVIAVQPAEEGGLTDVILDKTMFYPRGGGQDSDAGSIKAATGEFNVQKVRFAEGVVHHIGTFLSGDFSAGAGVESKINRNRRFLNSRLHTAGHVIDEAVRNLGLGWTPTKGIHYPGQAAVEYSGVCGDAAAAALQIEAEANRLIKGGSLIRAALVAADELQQQAYFIPPNLPRNKPIRVVTVGGDKGVPCGGMHVRNVADVGAIKIRYVKAKKDTVRVAYEINP